MQRHYLWLPVAFAFGSISCSTDTRTPEIQLDQVATHGITIGIPDFMQVPAADSLSPDSTRAWIGNSPSTDDWPFQIDIRPPSRRDWYWGTDRALNCADCLTHRDLIAWSEMRGSNILVDYSFGRVSGSPYHWHQATRLIASVSDSSGPRVTVEVIGGPRDGDILRAIGRSIHIDEVHLTSQ